MNQLIQGVRLFTGVDEHVIEEGVVWVNGDRIRFAGSLNDCPTLPDGIRRHTFEGQFVMPGMTETHAHLSFADANPFAIGETGVETGTITAVRNARLMLASGFTSAVSFGSTYQIDVALREAINSGQVIGPRLRAAGRDDRGAPRGWVLPPDRSLSLIRALLNFWQQVLRQHFEFLSILYYNLQHDLCNYCGMHRPRQSYSVWNTEHRPTKNGSRRGCGPIRAPARVSFSTRGAARCPAGSSPRSSLSTPSRSGPTGRSTSSRKPAARSTAYA